MDDGRYTKTVVIDGIERSDDSSNTAPLAITQAARHSEPFIRETIGGRRRNALGFGRLAVLVILAAIFFGAGAGFIMPLSEKLFNGNTQDNSNQPNNTADTNDGVMLSSADKTGQTILPQALSYAALIEQVEPSVVSIITNTKYQTGYGGSGIFGDGGIFENDIVEIPSAGSGIIFHETDRNYYIATNYHVIESASEVTVSICGSKPISAVYIDGNAGSDLAVISVPKKLVEAEGITSVKLAVFGESGTMRVGDEVLAIGNALGEGNTATNGIISAKDKTITIEGITLEVLQTNAAINPGNSGGPLINMNGEIIGINTAKISQSSAEGMGYSIPSDIAMPIIKEIMDIVNKPFIGIQLDTVSNEMAQRYNLPAAGAIIKGIVLGSPAEESDLQLEDIVTAFNGETVESSERLIELVGACQIGDVCKLDIIRNGTESMTIEIVLGHR